MSVEFRSYKREVLTAEQEARDRVLNRLGSIAEGYAIKLCPVKTGNLRNSITHWQMDENTEAIGTNVEYAPYVELGHHTVSGGYVAPKAFLRPAVENHKEEYRRIVEMELGR